MKNSLEYLARKDYSPEQLNARRRALHALAKAQAQRGFAKLAEENTRRACREARDIVFNSDDPQDAKDAADTATAYAEVARAAADEATRQANYATNDADAIADAARAYEREARTAAHDAEWEAMNCADYITDNEPSTHPKPAA
jgi:hypothetical protein